MCSLTIVSWNVRGIMSSTMCLSELINLTLCDICIISEHKLKESSLGFMHSLENDYCCIAKSAHLPPEYKAYHGKGGIEILYKSSLQFSINEIYEIYSERIVCIELKQSII